MMGKEDPAAVRAMVARSHTSANLHLYGTYTRGWPARRELEVAGVAQRKRNGSHQESK